MGFQSRGRRVPADVSQRTSTLSESVHGTKYSGITNSIVLSKLNKKNGY